MKANIEVMKSTNEKGFNLMASVDIRNLIDEDAEADDTGFTITGARGPEPTPIRDRVRRIVDRVGDYIDPKPAPADDRLLAAKDLYTKKARFSQNIHYLDKATDKTLFVDTGKTIAMRRTGITEAGVAVALQLAKERFGSTLTINGSAEFKTLVIEAAAKNGLDIHFTDKSMNQSLAARRTELEIGSSDAVITAAVKEVHPGTEAWSDEGKAKIETVSTDPLEVTTLNGEPIVLLAAPPGGWTKDAVIEQLTASLSAKVFADGFDASISDIWVASTDPQREAMRAVESTLKSAAAAAVAGDAVADQAPVNGAAAAGENLMGSIFNAEREARWRAGAGLSEAEVMASDTHMASRGSDHAVWLIADPQAPADGLDLVRSYLRNDAYRAAFKSAVEDLYKSFADLPDLIDQLDKNTTVHVGLVHEVEKALHIDGGQQASRGGAPGASSSNRKGPGADKVGVLISHGPAPYQNDDKNSESYFVTLDTPYGPKTSWGVGLKDAMEAEDKTFVLGDTVQLRDLGTMPVTIMVPNAEGVEEPVEVERRSWSAEVITTSADKTTVQQEESGPVMD
ncbi:LPD7 domain-containing protein [Pseudomonas fragariae (ex Marin et al. 2024)]|uniref:LPD7 domain-containing protein n=1 Tax=Pseudomonas fragariae (ex Marin et al. 2024) TaxID=3080056 RepID=UPI003F7B254D